MHQILIVEDDPALSQGIRLALGQEGRQFVQAGTIGQAELELAERTFDLLILDLNLPDGNGLDLLSRLIYAEAGCTWIPDWVQRMVGSVVLNRVNSPYYPDTIYDVIYQPGQYAPTWDGSIHKTPDARTIENARYLLENGSICPENVVGQNSIVTGSGVYTSYQDPILGTTVYFCYL